MLSYNSNKISFDEIDKRLELLDSNRPLEKSVLKNLKEHNTLDFIYNSNAIEGNTLTLRETKVVLEGLTIGGKTINEHLEVTNHKEAIDFLEELVNERCIITERIIKEIHALILQTIDRKNAGKYRDANVIITGASHIPPEHYLVKELMEKLLTDYYSWENFHPIIRSAFLHGEFVKIHPFIDGNGRTARLLMNFELMKFGYPPITIKNANKLKYYDALDKAHTTEDYTDFIKLIATEELEMLDFYLNIIGVHAKT
ncbi:MAG: Fic family protein [Christensenellaceae bacterium]|jgi:Fic family protein|nr:Fic family protein [Christensenellaceae bacterium]